MGDQLELVCINFKASPDLDSNHNVQTPEQTQRIPRQLDALSSPSTLDSGSDIGHSCAVLYQITISVTNPAIPTLGVKAVKSTSFEGGPPLSLDLCPSSSKSEHSILAVKGSRALYQAAYDL